MDLSAEKQALNNKETE